MVENVSASRSYIQDDLKTNNQTDFTPEAKDDVKAEVQNEPVESPGESNGPLNTISVIKARDNNGIESEINDSGGKHVIGEGSVENIAEEGSVENIAEEGSVENIAEEGSVEEKETVIVGDNIVTRTDTKTVTTDKSVVEIEETNGIRTETTDTSQVVGTSPESVGTDEEVDKSAEEHIETTTGERYIDTDKMAEYEDKPKETYNGIEKDIKQLTLTDTAGDRKQELSRNGVSTVNIDNTTPKEEVAGASYSISKAEGATSKAEGATSKAEGATSKAFDEDGEFRAMTEEEIQTIITKYSFMDPVKRRKCLRFFWSIDVDRWGYFTYPQLLYWYRAQGTTMADRDICGIFVDLDLDGDRLVSLDEFLSEMSKERPRLNTKEELKDLFEYFDRNQDGYVCESDIHATLSSVNPDYTPSYFHAADALEYDHTGERRRLDFKDFSTYMNEAMEKRMANPKHKF